MPTILTEVVTATVTKEMWKTKPDVEDPDQKKEMIASSKHGKNAERVAFVLPDAQRHREHVMQ